MLRWRYGIVLLAMCLASNAAAAATFKGTVRNGTTGKPSAGDEVVFLSAGHGMRELGRSRTDSRGNFSFNIAAMPGILVRVVHQGVDYGMITSSGAEPVRIQVYDVGGKPEGLTVLWKTQRFQTEREELQVIEEMVVRNGSEPPRTLMTFDIQLPSEAEIVNGAAQTGEGQPLKLLPVPGAQKGEYYFAFPVRPGDTRFAVAFRLPYKSPAQFESRTRYPLQQFTVLYPKTMKFEAETPGLFKPAPEEDQRNVQMIRPVKQGQRLAFRLSGMGRLAEPERNEPTAQHDRLPQASPAKGPTSSTESPAIQGNFWRLTLGGAGAALIIACAALFIVHRRKRSQVPPTETHNTEGHAKR